MFFNPLLSSGNKNAAEPIVMQPSPLDGIGIRKFTLPGFVPAQVQRGQGRV